MVSALGVIAVATGIAPLVPIFFIYFYSMFQMPRKYIRKTYKDKWTAEDLKKAKTAIIRGLSIRKAADQFKILFSPLQERMKSGIDSDPSLGRECVFPPAYEAALADHVKTLSKIFNGITALKLRKIAFEYAEKKTS